MNYSYLLSFQARNEFWEIPIYKFVLFKDESISLVFKKLRETVGNVQLLEECTFRCFVICVVVLSRAGGDTRWYS